MSNIITDESLIRYTQPDHTIHYVQQIYKNVTEVDPSWMVEVRRLGQYRMLDGTTSPAEQSTAAQLLQFEEGNWLPGLAQWVAEKVRTAAPLGIGAFLSPALLNDRRANDNSVRQLVTVCADFDTGNPQQQLNALCTRLGSRPTMTCTSGGTTKEGFPKLHAHWRLDEPCDDPWKVAYIREQLAKLYGADQSFKRIPQIIRIPGALYDKNGQWGTTLIIEFNDIDVGMMQWEEALEIDWDNISPDSMFAKGEKKTKEERDARLHQLQTEEVHEGRTSDTRWDRFSEYAGHQIRQARFGHQSVEEAFASTIIWVNDKMVPAWDEQRIDAEFRALLQRDKVNHEMTWSERDKPPIQFMQQNNPMNAPGQGIVQQVPGVSPEQMPEATPSPHEIWELDMFGMETIYQGEAPEERHLIENFLVHGSSVALVADGGVGKTYVSLELALRAAAGPDLANNRFLGFNILERMCAVVFTVEDGQNDIHRRLCAIDPSGTLRKAAGNNCVVVPVQEQIMDGLTLAEKDNKGNFGPSRAWKAMQDFIRQYLERRKIKNGVENPLLIIIDTYSATHHADENNAIGTNEWFRAASLLRQFEATLLVTHHVRKADPKMEIKTPSDMKAAVRGSSAFLNSVRICYGIWEMPNADAVVKELRHVVEEGARLFNMGVLKNNTGISWADRSDPRYPDPMITLRRTGFGQLMYDAMAQQKRIELTAGRKDRIEAARSQLKAAIIHAVAWYAQQGWPLSERNLTLDKEQFLPPIIREMSREKEIKPVLQQLLAEGVIKQLKIKKITGNVLDVPEGAFSAGTEQERKPITPAMQWAQYKYDAENECYNEIPNAQFLMDV